MNGITTIISLQGRARRNALGASRALQRRRAQRAEVECAVAAAGPGIQQAATPRT